MSEYWIFKDDDKRIYVRLEEKIPIDGEQVQKGDQDMKDWESKPGEGDGTTTNTDQI